VPDQIIDKRKIGFFHGAISDWFRAQTGGAISDYLLGPSPRSSAILDRRNVESLVASHAAGGSENGRLLLSILLLEVWLATFLPRALGTAKTPSIAGPAAPAVVHAHRD
jgi:asparagine synthase